MRQEDNILEALSSKEIGQNLIDQSISVLIVDDEAIIRAGLKRILAEYSHINFVAEAASGEEAEQMIEQYSPQVVLMDISMPGQGGIETTKRAMLLNPKIRILALSVHCDDQYPSQILNAGAVGYITKGVSADEMVEAINTVHKGEHYICNAVADKIRSVHLLGRDRLFDCLDSIEVKVSSDIVIGESLESIAERQNLTTEEVTQIRQAIFDKLHIQNDVALVHLAIRNGLLDKDDETVN